MTPQEIFDKAALGVLNQGKRSVDGSERCLYRGPNGLKCAVGHLVDNEAIAKEMDYYGSISSVLSSPYLGLPYWMRANELLLAKLQRVHDRQFNWRDGTRSLAAAFRSVAEAYHLSPAAIDQWEAKHLANA